MSLMNKLATSKNSFQGDYKRVLFVCSAGLLRSATAAHVFSAEPYNWNTRTVGTSTEFALNEVTHVLIYWADEIFVMEKYHLDAIRDAWPEVYEAHKEKFHILDVPDMFPYREPELVTMLKYQMEKVRKEAGLDPADPTIIPIKKKRRKKVKMEKAWALQPKPIPDDAA
jgi:predicted protein tyrosine phosphatase